MATPFRRNAKNSFMVLLIVTSLSTLLILHYLTGERNDKPIQNMLPEFKSIGTHAGYTIGTTKTDTQIENTLFQSKPGVKDTEGASKVTFPSISATREKIRTDIQDFLHFAHKNMSQLIPELGGVPIRCMISTSWRSGSTFTGEALATHPGAFYHYEPLWREVLMHRLRNVSEAQQALNVLKNQLLCRYTALKKVGGLNLSTPNRISWFGRRPEIRSQEDISSYCSLHPIQIIKILRVGGELLKTLLEDSSLDVRIIVMVRDPRALMHSRKHVGFNRYEEVNNTSLVCRDHYDEHKYLKELETLFPGRIMGIRFEDIASNSQKLIPELYDFCGLQTTETLHKYVKAHTNPDNKDYTGKTTYSTYRNTTNVSFEWREKLNWTEIDNIQRLCSEAMDAWGYNKVERDSMMNVETFTANIP